MEEMTDAYGLLIALKGHDRFKELPLKEQSIYIDETVDLIKALAEQDLKAKELGFITDNPTL